MKARLSSYFNTEAEASATVSDYKENINVCEEKRLLSLNCNKTTYFLDKCAQIDPNP